MRLTPQTSGGTMRARSITALLALSMALAGCQGGGAVSPGEEATDDQTVEVTPGTPAPQSSPPDQPALPDSSPGVTTCDDAVTEAIVAAIAGQSESLRGGDFEAAYAFASPSFQAAVPLDVFTRLIRQDYSPLLTADNPRAGLCEGDTDTGFATIQIRFATPSGPAYALRYTVELVEGRWRIAGAVEEAVTDTVA